MNRTWTHGAVIGVALLAALCMGANTTDQTALARLGRQQAAATAHVVTIYTARATTLLARASGPKLVSLEVAAPLQVTARHGAWSTVSFTAWVRAGGGKVLYVDTGTTGSAIRGGQVVATLPKALVVKTNAGTGVTWDKVVLAGVVKIDDTVNNQNTLWKSAKVYYTSSCGVCHALHAPGQFTSERWPANIKAMGHNTALTPAQLDLVLKYLQWHASDMPKGGS
jgi:hypothetical protein